MPIGVRDFLLVLRAQDQASRVISNVGRSMGTLGQSSQITGAQVSAAGSSLIGIGAAIGAVGAAGLAFFGAATKAAMDYNNEAALTFTQVDKGKASLEDIKRIGKEVATAIPASFKEMQKSLYDIFSSMDVNATQAQTLLANFAKGAVAGQTDVQNAARASISIMNAFKIPVEDVSKVMDVQFQAVRKGVFTYSEFASSIGRAIPSTVKAGGSIEDLSGMMAFLTRNGLSAAMAATSSARAFDLLANPKFRNAMHDFGIEVVDAKGNFRPMLDVVTDLRKRLEGLNEGDRAKVLTSLTKGAGGTIQAMRFLNLAVQDSGGLLAELTSNMKNASGAAKEAYDKMLKDPKVQLQLLKNNWQVLRTEIGDMFIPILVKLTGYGAKVIKWFNDLDPGLRDNIIRFAAIGAVVLTVTGALVAIGGVILLFIGELMMMGVTLGGAIAILAAIPLAIALVGVAIYLLIQHSEEARAAVEAAWTFIHDTTIAAFDAVSAKITEIWTNISSTVTLLSDIISETVKNVFGGIAKWWDSFGPKFFAQISGLWQMIVDNTKAVWDLLGPAISNVLMVIMGIIGGFVAVVNYVWNEFGDNILRIVTAVWNMIVEVVRGALNVIFGLVKFVLAVLGGDWGKAWDALKQVVDGAWDAIFGVLRGAVLIVANIIGTLVEVIMSPLRNLWDKMYDFGKNIVQGLIDGISGMIGKLEKKVGDMIGGITKPLSMFKFGSPSKYMFERGSWLGEGMANGIDDAAKLVEEAAAYLAKAAVPPMVGVGGRPGGLGSGAPEYLPVASSTGGNVSLTLESGAIQISGVSEPAAVGAVVDEKLRTLLSELRARN